MPTTPTLTNSTRQPKPSMIQNSSGAKQASPRYSPTVYTAVAFARSCCGNQALTTRLFTGKHGASLTPSPKRHSSSVFSPTAMPWNRVNSDHRVSDRK